MGAKLANQDADVPLRLMYDGDVAVITNWEITVHIGAVVQRHGETLIKIGAPRSKAWPEIFKELKDDRLRVRILQSGEQIEIT